LEHNKSDYRLSGSHLAVPCVGCHKKINLGAPKETDQFKFPALRCQTCHNNPHRHEVDKYLEKDGCEKCHSTESWKISKFDHDSTKFPLRGKHKKITCKDCHKPFSPEKEPAYLKFQKVIKLCQNCHEDIHLGQFRDIEIYNKTSKNFTRCERCHTPVDWLAEKFDHNRHAKFKLDGGHENVPCDQCHLKKKIGSKEITIYKPVSTECRFCHTKK
jgi:predicted CXXCH cytochrome family protein